MKPKKSLNFFFLIIAGILGGVLFSQFNFKTLKFEHTPLAIIYLIAFVISILLIIKDYRKHPGK